MDIELLRCVAKAAVGVFLVGITSGCGGGSKTEPEITVDTPEEEPVYRPGIGASSYPHYVDKGTCRSRDEFEAGRTYNPIEPDSGLVLDNSFTFSHSPNGAQYDLPWRMGEVTFDIRLSDEAAFALATVQYARLGACTTWEIWSDPYTAGYYDEWVNGRTDYESIIDFEVTGDGWTTVTFPTHRHYYGRYDDAIVLDIENADSFAIRNIAFRNTEADDTTPLTEFYY